MTLNKYLGREYEAKKDILRGCGCCEPDCMTNKEERVIVIDIKPKESRYKLVVMNKDERIDPQIYKVSESELKSEFKHIRGKRHILFYRRKEEYGWMSNFWRAEIEVDGKKYPTVEHFYQSMKANDSEIERWIREAPNPFLAMISGRGLRGDKERVAYWDEYKVGHMVKGLRAKFRQHENLRQMLLDTGDAEIHENSDTDMFWGILGEDMLGKLLMQVREELRRY